MEVRVLEWLRSPTGRALAADLPRYADSTALAVASSLRSQGHAPDLVAAALTQQRLRDRARERLGPDAARLWFTADGAEQATRPLVAQRRAERFAAAGCTRVADLGCGIGADAIAFARAGLAVTAYELDPATARVARANAEDLGLADRIRVVTADARDADLGEVDAAFADPARRRGGRRLLDPESWSPPFSWVVATAARVPATAAKVAPGLDRALPPEGTETEWVSLDGDLLEACVWFGPLAAAGVRRRATVLPSGEQLTDVSLNDPDVGPVGGFLVEPDDAVIRAGLLAHVAERVGGHLVDRTIAYVSTDAPPPTAALWTAYAVVAVMPFQLKRLRTELRARGIGRVEVKKRGSAIEPDSLRRQLRLDRDATASATLVLTRVAGEPTVLLVDRLRG